MYIPEARIACNTPAGFVILVEIFLTYRKQIFARFLVLRVSLM